jgi:hypothetical protein
MRIHFGARENSNLSAGQGQSCAGSSHLKLRAGLMLMAVICLLTSCGRLQAQVDTSTIAGTVYDSTRAVVPGAVVVVTNSKTNQTFTTRTDRHGEYFAPNLGASVYQLTVSKAGFRTLTISGVVVHAQSGVTQNAVLKVGTSEQTVTVNANAVRPNTETSSLGTTITAHQVSQLPINGRDIMDLIALVPGAVQNTGSSVNSDSIGGFPSGQFGGAVNMDGSDATRVDANVVFSTFGRGNARITRSSVDNVKEVKVLSSNYSAEYGGAIGDIINIVTKSGTNRLHGEAFEFFRNDVLDAKNYFNSGKRVPLKLNQFGGNLGGPIIHNKLFFFGNYEGVRQRVTTLQVGETLVLNQKMRSMAVPSMAPIIDKIPLGNGGPAPTVNNVKYGYWFDVLNGTTYNDQNENTYALKLDYVQSPKNKFSARFNYNQSDTYGTYGLAIGQYESAPEYVRMFHFGWNYVGSNTFLNELGFNINSPDSHQTAGEPGLPIISCFFCNVGLGLTPSPALFASKEPAIDYDLTDTATKIIGRNQLRFGLDMRWNNVGRELDKQYTIQYYGGPTVEAATTLPCNGQPQGTNGCIDPSGGPELFLQNQGEGYSVLGYPMTHINNLMSAYFINDDLKLLPNLSLNLGVRYQFDTVLHDSKGLLQNFNVSTLSLDKPGAQLYAPSYVDWAPRLGFNWDPYGNGQTSVRGGFGLFFLPISAGSPLNVATNTEQNVSINLLAIAFQGVTCNPPVTSVQFPLPTTVPNCQPQAPLNVTAVDPHQRDSYSEQWSLAVDQQLAKNVVLTLAYRGNRGLRLPSGYNLNLAKPNPDGTAPAAGAPLTYELSNQWGSVNWSGQFAASDYNDFNAAIRVNTHGLSLQANYNWSHEFDDVMGLFEAYQNPRDLKSAWAPGDIDVRNAFTVGAVYNAPRIPKLPRRLATGWELSTIIQGRTPTPVNFSYNAYDPASSSLRPDCVPGISPRATKWSPKNQFNVAAFTAPKLAYGTCPRNYGRGTNYLQPDMAVVKTTKLTGRLSWELRAGIFDVLNHPNFSNPGGTVNGFSFGSSYSTIGNLVGQGTSRQIQLSTKIIF